MASDLIAQRTMLQQAGRVKEWCELLGDAELLQRIGHTKGRRVPGVPAMPRAHGCPAVVPGAAAVSTASATRSITAGLPSQGTRVAKLPAVSDESSGATRSFTCTTSARAGPREPGVGYPFCVADLEDAFPRKRLVKSCTRRLRGNAALFAEQPERLLPCSG
jgi:hypothetical protein